VENGREISRRAGEKQAVQGRNPQTGQKMKIAAQKVPAFTAGNVLKEGV
jgi:DNA-binding protein HU-beta